MDHTIVLNILILQENKIMVSLLRIRFEIGISLNYGGKIAMFYRLRTT
jgi:hypothetical protein